MENKSIKELLDLEGKTAIVTGGAMGIGYGIAKRLAEAGANVVVADINAAAAEESAKKLEAKGLKVLALTLDVSQSDSIDNTVSKTAAHYGGIDILVNNAGIYPFISLLDIKESDIDRIAGVNLKGSMLMSQAVAKTMIKQGRGGKIINITSIDALHPSSVGLAIYDSTKHGLWGFTKNIALELAQHSIYVNAIAPGGITTPGTGSGNNINEVTRKFIEKIPMKRMGESDEIGKVALFLASDLSSYMTGSQIVVDGGALLS
ncbi:MAG: SDR family NAD(P)-dependent oxidoreductase [Candidatus Paceibacterota bacterium]|jgi:2-deoxy-D-gluconate 3-dehydrogenase